MHKQYVYPDPEKSQILVVDVDGHPLPRNSQGEFVKPDGSLVEKDSNNKFVNKKDFKSISFSYIGSDNQPLPKNDQGYYVYTDTEPKRLPTDSSGENTILIL